MDRFSDLVDRVKAATGLASSYAVANKIGVQNSLFYRYIKEKRFPTDYQLLELCELAGEDYGYWHLVIASRRAKNAKIASLLRDAADTLAA